MNFVVFRKDYRPQGSSMIEFSCVYSYTFTHMQRDTSLGIFPGGKKLFFFPFGHILNDSLKIMMCKKYGRQTEHTHNLSCIRVHTRAICIQPSSCHFQPTIISHLSAMLYLLFSTHLLQVGVWRPSEQESPSASCHQRTSSSLFCPPPRHTGICVSCKSVLVFKERFGIFFKAMLWG